MNESHIFVNLKFFMSIINLKEFFLSIFLIVSVNKIYSQQTMSPVDEDFEGNVQLTTSDVSNSDFINGIRWVSCVGDEASTISVVSDPYDSSVSNNVLKYEDSGGYYSQIRYETEKKMDLSSLNKFIVKVYIPSETSVGTSSGGRDYPSLSFRLQNRDLGDPWNYEKAIHKNLEYDKWQWVEFDFKQEFGTSVTGNTDFDRIVIQFNYEANNDSVIGYLDDLIASEGGDFQTPESMEPLGDDFEGDVNVNGSDDSGTWSHTGNDKDSTFYPTNEGIRYMPGGGSDNELVKLNVVTDPTDSSNKVLLYEDTGNYYAQMRYQTSKKMNLSTKNKFTVRAYVPSALSSGSSSGGKTYPVLSFRLQNRDIGSPWNSEKAIHKEIEFDQWNTVEFDFKMQFGEDITTNYDFNQIVIQFNMEANSDSVVGYLDDITVSEGGNAIPSQPSTQAPNPGYSPSDVLSVWSSRYQDGYAFDNFSFGQSSSNGNTFNPNWNQSSTTLSKFDGVNEDLMKFTNLTYQGHNFSPSLDITEFDYIHLDIWAKENGSLEFYLLDDISPELKQKIDVIGQQWNTIKLKLCDFDIYDKSLNKSAVREFKWENSGGTIPPSIFYVANVIFYKDSSIVCTGAQADQEPNVLADNPSISSDNVVSIFGDSYESLDWSGAFNTFSWNSGSIIIPYNLSDNSGNQLIKFKDINYGAVALEATSQNNGTNQNFTGMTHMVMDIWSKNGDSFQFVFFDNDTSGSEQTSVLSVGESETWKRIIVPLTDFHSSPLERELSLATVSGFKFERVSTNSNIELMYIDNWFLTNDSTLGLNSLETFKFSIYPNPVNEIMTLENANCSEVEIYNLIGKKIKSATVINNNINLGELNKGIYFIKAGDNILKFLKK